MGGVPVAQRAVALPWLLPSTIALLALTDDPPSRAALIDDPGAVLHLLRYVRPTPQPVDFSFTPTVLTQSAPCGTAASFLELADSHTIRPDSHARNIGRFAARVASELAHSTNLCTPDAAWATALLAPLGWYAAESADPSSTVNRSEAATIARQLVTRWRLPRSLAITLGFPDFSPHDAAKLGADPGLHRIVQAAITVAEQRLGWPANEPVGERTGHALHSETQRIADTIPPLPDIATVSVDRGLLVRLLKATAAARQRSGVAVVAELEQHVERMTALLSDTRSQFEIALRDAKLTAMAEFAAGASHEINNPLAVISGNAQLLLAGEHEPDHRRRLEAMVRATNRVHDILVGTRQFARPPEPQPTPVPVGEILNEELSAFRAADDRSLTIEPVAVPQDVIAFADAGQFRHILRAILRNAIEAVPANGWLRASVQLIADTVRVTIEDSGPGPDTEMIPHLFDPFFSGRSAGRGRGLGLSQAWRLAQQNGGDVAYVRSGNGPTCFTVTLPLAKSDATMGARDDRHSA